MMSKKYIKYSDKRHKYIYNKNLIMIFFAVIILSICIGLIQSQPRCTVTGIPETLPALQSEHVLLDMIRYFEGPNLTMFLYSNSSFVSLKEKYYVKEELHHLNNILEVKNTEDIVTMLGVTSVGRYFIYYANVSTPHNLQVKQVPISLKSCINHAITRKQPYQISLTCSQSPTSFTIATSLVSPTSPWIIHKSKNYINCTDTPNCTDREIEYISDNHAAVIIKHKNNSYIQVWDTKYDRLVGVYDRVYFGLQIFQIVDVEVEGGNLYLLVSGVGIMELEWKMGFYFRRVLDVGYSENMAVGVASIVVAKKGTLTQFAGRNVFKYQAVGHQTINDLIVSDQYILVYTQDQVIAYLRGYHTPYFTIPTQNLLIAGTFLNNTVILQAVSSQFSTQTRIQLLNLSHPLLSLPSGTPSNTHVKIFATSTLQPIQQSCNLQFNLVRKNQMQKQIFETQDTTKNGTQHLFMNRPGRAEIDLSKYGMGPNLNYDVQMFVQTVNLTIQVRKMRKIEAVIIQGLDKIQVKNTYFSESCGVFSAQCPFVVDTNTLGMMRFYLCRLENDFYGLAHKINCTQYFKQFKPSQYIHYQLQQPNSNPSFFQLSVLASNQNEVRVRKFQITDKFFTPRITSYLKIESNSSSGTNKYGQNNITQLQFDSDDNMLFVLLPAIKQIRVYSVLFLQDDAEFMEVVRINAGVLGGRYFAPQEFQLDSDGGLWVKCYDEILVFDFRNYDKVDKPAILSVINIDVNFVKNYNYTFQVVQQIKTSHLFAPSSPPTSTKTYQQLNRKYLILYNSLDTLLMCTVSHIYQIDEKQLQPLPRYGYHVPQDPNQRVIQSLGNSQVLITLLGYGETKIHMIYSLDSLTLVSAFYADIETRLTTIPAYFYLSSNNPIALFIQTAGNSSQCFAYQLSIPPKMLLTLTQMLGQTLSQQLILRIFNDKSQIRHSVVLSISNYPQNMTKGRNYPYPNVRRSATQKYIEIQTQGWVIGNVINISYACVDCEPKEEGAWVDVKGKLWKKQQLQLAGGHQYQISRATPNQPLPRLSITLQNLLYTASPSQNQILSSHQLTTNPNDEILYIKSNQQYHLTIALLKNENNELFLVSYSMSNYKGFELSRLMLPTSVRYVLSMEFYGQVIVLLDLDQVYVVGVSHLGVLKLIDNVNQLEAGGAICWAQLLMPFAKDSPYTLLLTLCQNGLTYLTFSISQSLQILTISNKQVLDLKQSLSNLNIQIPTDASFRRSLVVSRSETQLNIITIIRNYNSFKWVFRLRGIVVSQVRVQVIIHRFADFGVLSDVTVGADGRYAVIVYYGILEGVYQYVHAVYDFNDGHKLDQSQPYTHIYIMQTLTTPQNTRPQLLTPSLLLLPSTDFHHLSQFDIANKFRAVIHNEQQLLTQSVFMIPFTPVSSINAQIYITGIDVVVWEIWEILLLVMAGLILVGLAVFVFKVFFRKYQQNRKLVPLLTDYAEYEEDLEEEIREREQKRKSSGVEDKQGNINASDRGSLGV